LRPRPGAPPPPSTAARSTPASSPDTNKPPSGIDRAVGLGVVAEIIQPAHTRQRIAKILADARCLPEVAGTSGAVPRANVVRTRAGWARQPGVPSARN